MQLVVWKICLVMIFQKVKVLRNFRNLQYVLVHPILGNPSVTHSITTALDAVGTEWVTLGLPRMGLS